MAENGAFKGIWSLYSERVQYGSLRGNREGEMMGFELWVGSCEM